MADCVFVRPYIAHAHLIDRVVVLIVLLEDGDGLHQLQQGTLVQNVPLTCHGATLVH
jgi:hypothetical protein